MEELENEISTQAEENTVSLASAQALADALAKIEVYTPTTWVDNSSPDIDAEHLNKPEQAIKRVTDALNSAVDVIKDLQSQVTKNSGAISDVNNNLSKFYPGYYYNGTDTTSDIYAAMPNRSALFFSTNGDQKVGNELGFSKSYQGANVIIWKSSEWRGGALAIPNAGDGILLMAQISGANTLTWKKNEIASKSDLLNLSRTLASGDNFSDVKDLSISPGIYSTNPGLKNTPENTYGLLEVTADSLNNWRFLKFTPTNIKSFYLMFYNGYDKTWSNWAHFTSTTS